MSDDELDQLQGRLAAAVAEEDFELAARLRDALARLGESEPSTPSRLRRQVPGKMGLGSDRVAPSPPEGWTPPPKPDPMTSRTRAGGRRKPSRL